MLPTVTAPIANAATSVTLVTVRDTPACLKAFQSIDVNDTQSMIDKMQFKEDYHFQFLIICVTLHSLPKSGTNHLAQPLLGFSLGSKKY